MIDYQGLSRSDARDVAQAISRGDNFYGYIPSEAFDFILRNFEALRTQNVLEEAWVEAYIFKSHFNDYDLPLLQRVFEACDRARLHAMKPVGDPVNIAKSGRISLFRGCAGPIHRMGMSWTASLDKAIWYAAQKAAYYDQANIAVYATTLPINDIYCRFDRNEEEFIALPKKWWRIAVPADEFQLSRPR